MIINKISIFEIFTYVHIEYLFDINNIYLDLVNKIIAK